MIRCEHPVYSVGVDPSGAIFYTSGEYVVKHDGFRLHVGSLACLALNRAGDLIACGVDDDGAIRLFDRGGYPLAMLTGHVLGVTCIAFNHKDDVFASGSVDGDVRLWGPLGSRKTLDLHRDQVNAVSWNDRDDRVISCGDDGFVVVWDADLGLALLQIQSNMNMVESAIFHSETIIAGGSEGTIYVWGESGARNLAGHTDLVESMACSPCGRFVASGSWDHTVRVWEISGREVMCFEGHEDAVRSIVWSPKGNRIVSGSDDKTVRTWSVQLMLLMREIELWQLVAKQFPKAIRFLLINYASTMQALKGEMHPSGMVRFDRLYDYVRC